MQTPLLLVTPGDPDGIGPEIVWKAIQALPQLRLLCVGARAPFDRLGAPVTEVATPAEVTGGARVFLIPAPVKGTRAKLPGLQSGWSIETAARLVLAGQGDALVTGPISKARLNAAGYRFPGHTEFLAKLCATPSATMMLANSQLRVSLATVHLALSKVPRALSPVAIRRAILHTEEFLRRDLGIARPRLAVAALNPHAGEEGLLGSEERTMITPVIRALRKRGLSLEGPLPADTLFARHRLAQPKGLYDAVVCMYHDQALIPVKLLDFPRTVNISMGLPIVRTSVDHGVAFDIAGQGIADPSSMIAALELAAEIAAHRRRAL